MDFFFFFFFFFTLEEKIIKLKTFDLFCLFISTIFAANLNDLPSMRNVFGLKIVKS